MSRRQRKKGPVCPNCDEQLQESFEFCPTCGQENHDLRIPFGHFAYEFVENITHFDTKLWSTLKLIFSKPGQLTKDFVEGGKSGQGPISHSTYSLLPRTGVGGGQCCCPRGGHDVRRLHAKRRLDCVHVIRGPGRCECGQHHAIDVRLYRSPGTSCPRRHFLFDPCLASQTPDQRSHVTLDVPRGRFIVEAAPLTPFLHVPHRRVIPPPTAN